MDQRPYIQVLVWKLVEINILVRSKRHMEFGTLGIYMHLTHLGGRPPK